MAISDEGKIEIVLALVTGLGTGIVTLAPDTAKPIGWLLIIISVGGLAWLGLHHGRELWDRRLQSGGRKAIVIYVVAVISALALSGVTLWRGWPTSSAQTVSPQEQLIKPVPPTPLFADGGRIHIELLPPEQIIGGNIVFPMALHNIGNAKIPYFAYSQILFKSKLPISRHEEDNEMKIALELLNKKGIVRKDYGETSSQIEPGNIVIVKKTNEAISLDSYLSLGRNEFELYRFVIVQYVDRADEPDVFYFSAHCSKYEPLSGTPYDCTHDNYDKKLGQKVPKEIIKNVGP